MDDFHTGGPVSTPRRPLLLSYGGGHANIMIALALELDRREVAYDLIGLTTAFKAFERAGLRPYDVSVLEEPAEDAMFLDAAKGFIPDSGHPDITIAQTQAYFGLGFADLARRYGDEEASRLIARDGRKAFEPISIFERFFKQQPPSIVVATTSPRYELAALRAARRCAIPSIAIGDHFLIGESDYIASGDYADHLVVLSEAVEANLRQFGMTGPKVHVLGNPAFDQLAPKPQDEERRAMLRARLGFAEHKVLFWPLAGGQHSGSGERLLPPEEVIQMLEPIVADGSEWNYLLRQHPNWPVDFPDPANGVFCPEDMSPEDCLLVSDLVVVESSTLGLQAVLKNIPTISYRHGDYTVYPQFGWASVANSADELRSLVLGGDYLFPPKELGRLVGSATARTTDLILELQLQGEEAIDALAGPDVR